MFPSRYSSPITEDSNLFHHEASSPASITVTGSGGTVLATISRHTEDHPGGPSEPQLVVIDVAGDIDADTAPALRTVLTYAIGRDRRVCCDLSRVEFFGAAAVNTIFAALRDADGTDCQFTVRGVHGLAVQVCQVTGLAAVLASRA
ncbi:STAS domain-containing protein [Paractinoplanes maris]|uniref:STAS domain-containing protein n=1 Tax=Paractinoplanes maris TaxID=1734446 RepID=UPI0020202E9B|nr:STAS domain-containing protein [Actinoplanes maris]